MKIDNQFKVLYVRSTSGFYGAEKVISSLLGYFKISKIQCELICLENMTAESERLSYVIKDMGVDNISFKTSKKFDFSIIKKIKLHIINNDFGVIHTHDYKSLFYLFFISKTLNLPLIHHMHGALGNTLNEKIYGFIERILVSFVDKCIVVSHKQMDELKSDIFITPEVLFLENGIEINNDQKIRNQSRIFTISMVARFTAEKNHILALQAMSILISKNIDFIFNIYGNGPLHHDVEEYIKLNNLSEHVFLKGYLHDIEAAYTCTDLLLITSTTEGLPMTLLESMSYGIPSVSTKVGEIPNVLSEGECGLLVDFNAESIADTIQLLIDNKDQYDLLSDNAYRHVVNHYSINMQGDKLVNIYNECIKSC